jgi:hypothetical protein
LKYTYRFLAELQQADVASDHDFHRAFNRFYRVRRNAEWHRILEEGKSKTPSLAEVLLALRTGDGSDRGILRQQAGRDA